MSYTSILTGTRGHVGLVTLNRPEAMNALNPTILRELMEALEAFDAQEAIGAMVVAGGEKVFAAGADIKEMAEASEEQMRQSLFIGSFDRIRVIKKPIIAAVSGWALGGGCELACFCDLVIAAEGVKFGQPEIKVGVFPPVAAAAFPQYGFLKNVYELLLVGDALTAEQARAIGLVNQVFPRADFGKHCQDFLKRLTSNSAAILRLTKKTMKACLGKPFPEAIDIAEKLYLKDMMATKDAHEGLAAFIEKRAAKWEDE